MGNFLFVLTPVGAIGSGIGGGVELGLQNTALALQQKGHRVKILAPEGSLASGFELETVPGVWQSSAQTMDWDSPILMEESGVLVNLWERARLLQTQYDLIFNYAYDWLPFYLTPFFETPVAHAVSMAAINVTMKRMVQKVYQQFPERLSFLSHAQAATFGLTTGYHCVPYGIDLSLYEFCAQPLDYVAWVGRISPEKGLEDAIAACQQKGQSLRIYGKLQDPDYWQRLQADFPEAPVQYCGFLSTQALQEELRQSRALLMTSRWVEAFGNVVIEALACGVPVISYARGGPAEIIQQGITGLLVEPDNVDELRQALHNIDQLDRQACRQQAKHYYSLPAIADQLESWFRAILS